MEAKNQLSLKDILKTYKNYFFIILVYSIVLSVILLNSSVKDVVRGIFFENFFGIHWVIVFLFLSFFSAREIISQNKNHSSSIGQAKKIGTTLFSILFFTSSTILFFSISYFNDLGHGHGEYQSLGEFLFYIGFILLSIILETFFYLVSGILFKDCVIRPETGTANKNYPYKILPLFYLIVGIILMSDLIIFVSTKIEYLKLMNHYKSLKIEENSIGKQLRIKYKVEEESFPRNYSTSTSFSYEKMYNNIDKYIIRDFNDDGIKDISYVTQFYNKDNRDDNKSFLTISNLNNIQLKKCLISEKREYILDFDIIDFNQGKNIIIFGYSDSISDSDNRYRYFARIFDLESCNLLKEYNEDSLSYGNYRIRDKEEILKDPSKIKIEGGIVNVEENYTRCSVNLNSPKADNKIQCVPKEYTPPDDSVYYKPIRSVHIDIDGDNKQETVSILWSPAWGNGSKFIIKNSQDKIIGLLEDSTLYMNDIDIKSFQDIDGDGLLEYKIKRKNFAGPKRETVFEFIGF